MIYLIYFKLLIGFLEITSQLLKVDKNKARRSRFSGAT